MLRGDGQTRIFRFFGFQSLYVPMENSGTRAMRPKARESARIKRRNTKKRFTYSGCGGYDTALSHRRCGGQLKPSRKRPQSCFSIDFKFEILQPKHQPSIDRLCNFRRTT
jgi:hypothetical protein